MTAKHIINRESAIQLIENIDAAERKLRMMKQYIEAAAGTMRDPEIVRGLYLGTNECMSKIAILITQF